MDMGLEGRSCVVTGASRGIGLAVAERLCREEARVVLVARSTGPLDEAVARCSAAGGDATALALDVTEADAGATFERVSTGSSYMPYRAIKRTPKQVKDELRRLAHELRRWRRFATSMGHASR